MIAMYAFLVRDKNSDLWSMVLAPTPEEAGEFFKEAALCTDVIVSLVSKEEYEEYCKLMQDPENLKKTTIGYYYSHYTKGAIPG